MADYIIKRLLQGILVVLAVSITLFAHHADDARATPFC